MGSIPYQINPTVGVQLVDQEISKSVPFSKFVYADVTFNSTANGDTDIEHTLNSTDVDFQVVAWKFITAPATPPVCYRDISGTARAWGKNYVVLRCNVSGALATILLTTRRD